MRNFDEWLRDALLDANLLQFEKVLAEAGAQSFDFSPGYLRERTRMLADPFGWARRRGRSAWRRAARSAACVLLACTVALGALMAASPAVRAAVLNWLREFGGDSVTYSANPYASPTAPEDAALQDWQITWLPEGYTLWDFYTTPSFSKWTFLSVESGDSLDFGCSAPGGEARIEIGTIQNPESVRERVTVQGCTADYYSDSTEQLLVWETPGGFLLRLLAKGGVDRETLIKAAGSAACYTGDTPAFEMGWVPPDFHEIDGLYGNGAYHQEWTRRGVTLSWQYVVQPPCPFTVPEGEPEAVTVNGLPGRFWASRETPEVPDGPDGSTAQLGGITITASTSPAEETTSTLMWEDPETGTAFCLKGELGRDGLLRMAESVRQKEPPIAGVQPGRSEAVIGTAGGDGG